MTKQEKYLKEIATELKLIRELLEESDEMRTLEIKTEIGSKALKEIVNGENVKANHVFKL
ncbi:MULTISPECIES: hypothetical protein [Staphylococcus]|uniref:hypothetical protein n=1 Tax=Staphylococcus TaxID=1279 RepID=UPI00069E6ABF|nr:MULTISPECIES: hypothetical protein [Staphylococcus]AYX83220.1 hypothetical protein EGX85_02125 [Staphylococcus haemolyticus]MBF8037135.1 hypothetical protein [Staphylococcus epidermidis]MBF8059104.1 hypothetical protein [Staphylococcus epidermidis]MBK3939941.1 hypothetical protein [Staphylococcus haemolyticus]MBK3940008.1 hypothetical protein [Staphylococcus haemolyticus]